MMVSSPAIVPRMFFDSAGSDHVRKFSVRPGTKDHVHVLGEQGFPVLQELTGLLPPIPTPATTGGEGAEAVHTAERIKGIQSSHGAPLAKLSCADVSSSV